MVESLPLDHIGSVSTQKVTITANKKMKVTHSYLVFVILVYDKNRTKVTNVPEFRQIYNFYLVFLGSN